MKEGVLLFAGALLCLVTPVQAPIALAAGALLNFLLGSPQSASLRKITKHVLAMSVVGLGASMNLPLALSLGYKTFFLTLASLIAVILLAHLLGIIFRTPKSITTLIGVGTAICGGSAIAAVSAAIDSDEDSVAVSLGIVFALNAIALLVFPSIGEFAHLGQEQFGTWAALAIHDTSSVVGATMSFGSESLQVGTTLKLSRALWIIPVSVAYATFSGKPSASVSKWKRFLPPWFITGFVLFSALATWSVTFQEFTTQTTFAAKKGLILSIFFIGCGLNMRTFAKVGGKTLLHGLCLWLIVATSLLFIVREFY